MRYEEQNLENKYCLCCDRETEKNFLFCRDCYQNIKEITYNIDQKEYTTNKIINTYSRIKNKIEKDIKQNKINIKKFNTDIQTMFSLSEELSIHGNAYLTDNIYPDLITLNKKAKNKTETKEISYCICCKNKKAIFRNRYCEECKKIIFSKPQFKNNKYLDESYEEWINKICEKLNEKDQTKSHNINHEILAISENLQIRGDKGKLFEYTKKALNELNKDRYTRKYKCNDNHYVRSKAEKIIDDWLYDNNIAHAYEKELKTKEMKTIKPDFYLPKYKTYLEYWGIENNKKYQEIREYKEKYYNDNNINYISIEAKDDEEIDYVLEQKLKNLK